MFYLNEMTINICTFYLEILLSLISRILRQTELIRIEIHVVIFPLICSASNMFKSFNLSFILFTLILFVSYLISHSHVYLIQIRTGNNYFKFEYFIISIIWAIAQSRKPWIRRMEFQIAFRFVNFFPFDVSNTSWKKLS